MGTYKVVINKAIGGGYIPRDSDLYEAITNCPELMAFVDPDSDISEDLDIGHFPRHHPKLILIMEALGHLSLCGLVVVESPTPYYSIFDEGTCVEHLVTTHVSFDASVVGKDYSRYTSANVPWVPAPYLLELQEQVEELERAHPLDVNLSPVVDRIKELVAKFTPIEEG